MEIDFAQITAIIILQRGVVFLWSAVNCQVVFEFPSVGKTTRNGVTYVSIIITFTTVDYSW